MKTLTIVLKAMLLPLITLGQAQNLPSVSLKTLDDRTVNASEVIKEGKLTLVYFFDIYSKDFTDHFEYLEGLAANYKKQSDIKIIAICNTSSSNYNQLKPLLEGNSIDLETYIDLNGEFQRSMGMPANSAYLIFEPDQKFTYYYTETMDYHIDLIDNQMNSFAFNEGLY